MRVARIIFELLFMVFGVACMLAWNYFGASDRIAISGLFFLVIALLIGKVDKD